MQGQEILEGNKLIAEFIYDDSFIDDGDGDCYCESPNGMIDFYIEDAKYHTSWDWLIPVVKDIKLLVCESEFVYRFRGKLESFEIESVWFAVVEFIKWYNSCQKEEN